MIEFLDCSITTDTKFQQIYCAMNQCFVRKMAAETRDKALNFSKGTGLYEVVSRWFPQQWCFYC